MVHTDRRTAVRVAAVATLLPAALALPVTAAGAATPNKAAIEYSERIATGSDGRTKAAIENEELARLRDRNGAPAAPASPVSPVGADEFPWIAALSGLGAAALVVAGGVVVVRRHHEVPVSA